MKFLDDTLYSRNDLLSKVDQQAVAEWIFKIKIVPNHKCRNPFRAALPTDHPEYDSKPGTKFRWFGARFVLTDMAFAKYHSIDIVTMAMLWFECSYGEALELLYQKFVTSGALVNVNILRRLNRRFKGSKPIIYYSPYTKNNETIFSKFGLSYWEQYHLTLEDITRPEFGEKLFQIVQFRHSLKSNPNLFKTVVCNNSSFAIVMKSGSVKILRPYMNRDNKWFANTSEDDIGGVINYNYSYIIITKSFKDMCVLYKLGFNVVWLQNEGCKPSKKLIEKLFSQFSRIFILFDNDAAGIEASIEVSKHFISALTEYETTVSNIRLKGLYKDPADYSKAFGLTLLYNEIRSMMKIPYNFHPSWHEHVKSLFDSDIVANIAKEITKGTLIPKMTDVFKAFNMPISDVRVLMIGQDPYPNGEANGIAFAVNVGVFPPLSLRTIATSVQNYLGNPVYELDRTLERWSDQGILLLNAGMTMREGQPKSHIDIWQPFMVEIIKAVCKVNKSVILVSVGSHARSLIKATASKYPALKKYYYYHSVHPAAEKHRSGTFLNQNPSIFEKIDRVIYHLNGTKITW